MSIEKLFTPRFKVIADYPGCPFKVGQILEKIKTVSGKEFVRGMLHQPEDYPANFQRLEWWEERKPDEMPEYVKWDFNPKTDIIDTKGLVEKVIKWVHGGHTVITEGSMAIATCYWLPASKEEYDQYQKVSHA